MNSSLSKYVPLLLSYVLCDIINITLESGIFPVALNIARARPISKGGGENNLQDYMPIFVLPILSKVLEKLLYDKFESIFSLHKVIMKAECGFQKDKSTEFALLRIIGKIMKNMEEKSVRWVYSYRLLENI